jgi:hypothetical protein
VFRLQRDPGRAILYRAPSALKDDRAPPSRVGGGGGRRRLGGNDAASRRRARQRRRAHADPGVHVAQGWTSTTSCCYAVGSFFGGLHLLYLLLGFSRTGPLLTMISGAVFSEFVRWVFVYMPLLASFSFAFFALRSEHSWVGLVNHDLLYAFQSTTGADKAKDALNNNVDVDGQGNTAMWLLFFVLGNFLCCRSSPRCSSRW